MESSKRRQKFAKKKSSLQVVTNEVPSGNHLFAAGCQLVFVKVP